MATFDPTVNPTNDPSYLNFSRGTDNASLRPLADVPKLNTKYVEPDYKANTSAGKLLSGIGEVGSEGIKLGAAVKTTQMTDEITKGINDIRDSFGVASAVKNSGYAQDSAAAGADGNNVGAGGLLPKDPNLPPQIQRLGARIDGLKQGVADGSISNSSYYAKMESFVRQEKVANPGWSDDIDDIIKSKLGVTPANALRASLQNDADKLAAKVQAGADKQAQWERANGSTIATLYGGYENYQSQRATGKLPFSAVEARVNNYNSKLESEKAELQGIALNNARDSRLGNEVEKVTTVGAHSVVDGAQLALMQKFKLSDLTQVVQDMQSGKRPLPNPDEKEQLAAQFQLYETGVKNALDQYFDAPVFDASGHQATRRSMINNPQKVAEIQTASMSQIQTLKKAVFGNEDAPLMKFDAINAQARQDSTNRGVLTTFPQLTALNTFKEKAGPDIAFQLYMNSPAFQSPFLSGLQQANWGDIASGKSSVSNTLDKFRNEGVNDPQLNKGTIEDTKTIIHHPDKLRDPAVQTFAVQHLFGPANHDLTDQVFASSGRQATTAFFNSVVDPKTIHSISKMDKQYQGMVQTWAEANAPKVFQTEMNNANATAEANTQYNSLKLKYDPDQHKFFYEGQYPSAAPIVARANSQIDGLNQAVQSMKRVWEMSGKADVNGKLYSYLPMLGIDENSPVYKALQTEMEAEAGERVKAANPRAGNRY